jgi:hypothetical protein
MMQIKLAFLQIMSADAGMQIAFSDEQLKNPPASIRKS